MPPGPDVDQRVERLVGGAQDRDGGTVGDARLDEVGEITGQVDVGLFERPRRRPA